MAEKVVVKKIGEAYWVKLPYGFDELEINGERTKEEKICLSEAPRSMVGIKFETLTVGYKSKDGETTSVEEYVEMRDRLQESRIEDAYGDMVWPDLESEFEFRKFMDRWTAEKEDYEDRTEIEFLVEKYPESPHSYITSLRLIGGDPGKALYEYVPDPCAMAREVAKEFGFAEVEDRNFGSDRTEGKSFSIPSHGGIRFMKVNGSYVCNDGDKFPCIRAGSLKECTSRLEQNTNRLLEIFRKQLTIIEDEPIDKATRAKLISDLSSARSMVSRMSLKAKSEVKGSQLAKKLKEMEDALIAGNGGKHG